MAEAFPVYKKKDALDKENHRSVSVSHISKAFEIIIYKQIDDYMNDKLSPLLTGLKKNHNSQNCLLKVQ